MQASFSGRTVEGVVGQDEACWRSSAPLPSRWAEITIKLKAMEPYGWSHTHVRALVVVSRWAAMVTSLAGMGLELLKVSGEHSALNIYQLNHTRDRQHICISPSVEALTLDVIKQGRTSALESEAQAF